MNSIHATLRLTAHALVSPMQAVVDFFAPWEKDHQAPKTPDAAPSSKLQPVACSTAHLGRAANQARFRTQDPHPLALPASGKVRVLRVMDAAIPPHSAGRMVISGRLSEVCAELDRLSRQECPDASLPGIA